MCHVCSAPMSRRRCERATTVRPWPVLACLRRVRRLLMSAPSSANCALQDSSARTSFSRVRPLCIAAPPVRIAARRPMPMAACTLSTPRPGLSPCSSCANRASPVDWILSMFVSAPASPRASLPFLVAPHRPQRNVRPMSSSPPLLTVILLSPSPPLHARRSPPGVCAFMVLRCDAVRVLCSMPVCLALTFPYYTELTSIPTD
ncbi:uncharacterized protein C8Q71DRAFT_182313 [Rhodofomes roseus]|uniref:Uncharacterized protein n=1 Tax=Rhodofomes roseus TaxID=34475 RepID=A0ABQ8K8Z1_9APHY|nr:uncharacterized protein C8Q71DRAFT_518198 [Rhodofomes roseus]XP_047776165.1 uncharacterized protein C8Q71DRAFT_182313 [Rhodofomes roseus]KAH9828558.1 hypothetical protein C8Q71DRAFT_518198 [Rhodofomes roseus]KAH9833425.1 hypothetical protein C8Q71DRAFT_182313 [Rhodofomes roseus]